MSKEYLLWSIFKKEKIFLPIILTILKFLIIWLTKYIKMKPWLPNPSSIFL